MRWAPPLLSIWRGEVARCQPKPARRLRAPETAPVRVRRALATVATVYDVTVDDMLARPTPLHALEARDAAMYHLRQITDGRGHPYSLPKIGAWFGRDHSTVSAGIERHEARQSCCAQPVDTAHNHGDGKTAHRYNFPMLEPVGNFHA